MSIVNGKYVRYVSRPTVEKSVDGRDVVRLFGGRRTTLSERNREIRLSAQKHYVPDRIQG